MRKQRVLKLMSILFVLMMACSALLCGLPALATETEGEVTEVRTWGELINAVNSDQTHIKLLNDIEDIVPDDELPTKHRLLFNGGLDYVLDLNGHTLEVLNHINEFYTGEFAMIEVSNSSKLEVKDGSIIFDNYAAKANRKSKGVVAVKDDSALTAIQVHMQNKYTGSVVYANSNAQVTLEGGEYAVQNGFALYLENQASLTLNGPYIHTTMGDGTPTQYVDGYGALYSQSNGALVIHDAFFKSGVQISTSQLDAFSVATHELQINGEVLTEDIFRGTNYEAKQQNKEYYWYSWTGCSLMKTENSLFANPVRVISYEKKYPITVASGVAMIDGVSVTEASYGQKVTIVADAPEEGMEFLRWSANVLLDNNFSASTTFVMQPNPVTLTARYGKEAVKSVSVTVDDIVPGQEVNKTEITLASGALLQSVEWREESALKGDYAVFRAGKSYTVTMLVYPPEGNKFGDAVSATVNGKTATVNANAQYAYIEYTFEATPSVGFSVLYNVDDSQLGVGGKILLDTVLMASQSAEFKAALDADKVTYQWYRNGEAVLGATDSVYHFTAEDATGIFYVAVTADGKSNYGHNITCYSDLYRVYLNASDIVAGGKAPQMSVATPGVSIDAESMTIYEILGSNSYGDPQNIENAVLIPGRSYLLVGKIIEQDGVKLAYDASVYVNDALMKDTFDAGRFFYEFAVPEADYSVYYTVNGEIGIGVTLTVDVEKMCAESGTFKHAVEVQAANPTYQTVFYQWYRNGEEIKGATDVSYTVTTSDKDSYIHCKVALVDGEYGVGEQFEIKNVITVISITVPTPKDGEKRITGGIYADGVVMSGIMWWPQDTGATMQGNDTYVEGTVYEYLINFEAKEGFSLDFTGEMTVVYANGTKIAPAGSGNGAARYMGEITAIHQHQYSDTVWDFDEYCHWQPCIVPNCPNPNEEWETYTEHAGGTATCQTKGECAICGAEYLADHDFSVPDYEYVDDMKCANFCEHCDLWIDWSYHEGGVSTCQQKSVCDICHHEYGALAPCAGGTATCTEKAKCATCQKEYGALAPHDYNIENGYKGADGHANACACGAHEAPAAHTPDRKEATETDAVKCTACGYVIEPATGHVVHTPKVEWAKDANNHWHECIGCEGQQLEKAAHADANGDGKCDLCAYEMAVTPEPPSNPENPENPSEPQNPSAPEEPTEEKGGLGVGAIVGIVIGSVAVAGLGGFAIFWFVIKKKSLADILAVFKKEA